MIVDTGEITDYSAIAQKLEAIRAMKIPSFVTHVPDIADIRASCEPFLGYRNIIIIGNGGSINSSAALYGCLGSGKNVEFLTTMEPDYLNMLKKKYGPEDTLIMVISKSGTTVGPLESMFAFMPDYRIVAMTQDPDGTLMHIAKRKDMPIIIHPEIGGRYSGRTSCAMVPACLMGIDIEKFNSGCLKMYEKCAPSAGIENNPALRLAATLYLLEQQGKVDIFLPVYSTQLAGFLPLIVQLMHESFGKDGKGQSYFGGLSPETQHHTNQRFFGGRQNIAAIFMRVLEQHDGQSKVNVPEDLKDIRLREGVLGDIAGVPYAKALEFEFEGTYRDAQDKKIPSCLVSLEDVSDYSAGEFMAFWQYVAVYSSLLRDVDPYDQPQVESSKEISFQMRLEYEK